jgi:cytoskeletal protein RodZ
MIAPSADGGVATGAPDPAAPGPGAALRAAREAAGLSVEQVSESTRIRSALVRDLEADRFDSSGGAVYARGHLRALCRAVGTAPEPLVVLLDRRTGSSPEAVGHATPVAAPVTRTSGLAVPVPAPPERRGPAGPRPPSSPG